MRTKVALALALSHQPKVLVVDEPMSGLDSLVGREFIESKVDRAGEGRTVFVSHHQIHDVERVADTVGIIRHGWLMLVEPLDQLKPQLRELIVSWNEEC